MTSSEAGRRLLGDALGPAVVRAQLEIPLDAVDAAAELANDTAARVVQVPRSER